MADLTSAPPPKFMTAGPLFAVIAATVPGIAGGVMASQSPQQTMLVVVATTVTLIIGCAGMWWAERQEGTRALHVMIALYSLAMLASIWVSTGSAFLVAMPVVSIWVLFLPMRLALPFTLLTVGWLAAAIATLTHDLAVISGSVAGMGSAFAFVLVFSTIMRRERYARRDLALMSSELEVLAASRERNRIAREIHDSLGHYLTVANVQLEAARTVAEGRDERLLRVQALLKEGLNELRRSVSMLREGPLPPFTHAIADLVAECNDTGLAAELTTKGTERSVAGATGFTLYRAAQEALTNVRRHAQAKKVSLALDYQPATVTLRISDDGVGAEASSREGNGLTGLRERVELAGGTVKVEKPVAGGFAVVVQVPG